VRTCYSSAAKMILADEHLRRDYTARHEFVERKPHLCTFSVAEPCNSGRQHPESDLLLRHIEPAKQDGNIPKEFTPYVVSDFNILRIAAQCGESERAFAFTEKRADVGRYEAWKVEGIFHTVVKCHLTDIISVVEDYGAALLEFKHRFHMSCHGCRRQFYVFFGIRVTQLCRFPQTVPFRNIAVERVMGRCLIRDDIDLEAALQYFMM